MISLLFYLLRLKWPLNVDPFNRITVNQKSDAGSWRPR
jgi:hypothetical protein